MLQSIICFKKVGYPAPVKQHAHLAETYGDLFSGCELAGVGGPGPRTQCVTGRPWYNEFLHQSEKLVKTLWTSSVSEQPMVLSVLDNA